MCSLASVGRQKKWTSPHCRKVVGWTHEFELAMHRKCTAFQETHPILDTFGEYSIFASHRIEMPCENLNHRSISPITISSEPTIAGMSAMRQPAHSFSVTDKLQNDELLARARQGRLLSLPTR